MTKDERNRFEMAFAACALRFRGWDFIGPRSDEIAASFDGQEGNPNELSSDPAENFARLFYAQRSLAKCGPGLCADRSPMSVAAAFLFLHLYRTNPPAEWTDPAYVREWETNFAPRAEGYATLVRQWLVAEKADELPSAPDG